MALCIHSILVLDFVIVVQLLCLNSLANPVDCSPPGSSVVRFVRHRYWSGLSSPSPADLPDLEMEPVSPALAGGFLTTQPPGSPDFVIPGNRLYRKGNRQQVMFVFFGFYDQQFISALLLLC